MPDVRRPQALLAYARGMLRQSLYTNAMHLILAQAVMAGLGFFFWVIIARYYTEAEVGYSSAILSAISLMAFIGHMGLDSFLVRFMSGSEHQDRLVNTCLTYAALATAAAALVAASSFPLLSPRLAFVSRQPVFFAAFVCFSVVSTLSGICGSSFIAGRQARYLLLKDVVYSGTKLFLPLLFVQHFHAFGVVASWGLASALALCASLLLFMPRVIPGYVPRPTFGARLVRRAWGFSGMSYLISLIAATPRYVMPLLVINLLGPEENAYFYVAWAMSALLFSIPTSLGQSLFAEGSHDRRKLSRDIRRATLFSMALLLPAIVVLWLLGDVVLLAFGGSYSVRSVELLKILALASLPMTFERVYFTVLRIGGRLRELIVWRSVLSVTLLVACVTTVPILGLEAIGWVWFGVHSVAAVAMLLLRSELWLGR